MGNSIEEIQRGRRAARLVLDEAGHTPLGPIDLVSSARHLVYRVPVNGIGGPELRAVRIMQRTADPQLFRREQRIAFDASRRNAPVISPDHVSPIATTEGLGGVWEWHEFPGTVVTPMREWGAATKSFHVAAEAAGLGIGEERNTGLQKFSMGDMRARIALTPGHPLATTPSVVQLLEDRLEAAKVDVQDASATQPDVFLHGDNHRLNSGGSPFKFGDLEYAGPGPLANEFAIVALGAEVYRGWSGQHLTEFRHGYGSNAPTEADLKPFVRLQGLVWCGWVMMYGEGPEQKAELENRIAWVDQPSPDIPRWTHAGDRALMDASFLSIDGTQRAADVDRAFGPSRQLEQSRP